MSLEILEESAPLRVSGRFDARLADLDAADARLSAVADDGARTSGLAAALGALAQGIAVLASVALGIPATLSGSLSVEALAVVVLTPLAVFEATAGLPAAAVQLHRSREAARRLLELTAPGGSGWRPAPPAVEATLCSCSTAWPPAGPVARAGRAPPSKGCPSRCGRAVVALAGPSGVRKTTLLMTAAA